MNDNYHHGDLKNALIQAGLTILAEAGTGALSLRQVAKQVGVSHAAPYAHFSDKQALIAAIAAEGYKQLYEQVSAAAQEHPDEPRERLTAVAWAYVRFALEQPEQFKVTFSGAVEREADYPDYVEQAKRNFALMVEVVSACQDANLLPQGETDLLVMSLWASLHGLIYLLLGNQLPGALLTRFSPQDMLQFQLSQFFEGSARNSTANRAKNRVRDQAGDSP